MKKILLKDGMELSIIQRSEDFNTGYIQYILSIDYQIGTIVTTELREKLGLFRVEVQTVIDSVYSSIKGKSADGFIDFLVTETGKPSENRPKHEDLTKLFIYLESNIDKTVVI